MSTQDPKDGKPRSGERPGAPARKESPRRDDAAGSASGISPFLKDKRPRTTRQSYERNAPDQRRESPERRDEAPRRSYNPNFTSDNRRRYDDRPARDFNRDRDDRNFNREERDFNRHDTPSDGPRFTPPARKSPYPQQGGQRRNEGYGDRDNRPRRNDNYGNRDDRPRSYGDRDNRYPRRDDNFGNRDNYNREDRPRYGNRDNYNRDDRPRYGNRDNYNRDDRPRQGGHGGYQKGGKRPFQKEPTYDKNNYPRFEAPKPTGAIRLNRFIANSGVSSRREADDLIRAGLVTVNSEVVTEMGTKVLPTDQIRFNDEILRGEKRVYLLMNKPRGYVTSVEDPHADKLVMDLIGDACKERVYPVGRLDKNSVGVLLITNDGELTRQLTHPSYNKKKIYQVSVDKPVTEADMQRLADGIELDDGLIYADEVSYVKDNRKEVGIEIHSGRNRIVRRMFEALGYTVTKLDRVYFGGLTKKRLKRGAWRFLTPIEVGRLKSGEYE